MPAVIVSNGITAPASPALSTGSRRIAATAAMTSVTVTTTSLTHSASSARLAAARAAAMDDLMDHGEGPRQASGAAGIASPTMRASNGSATPMGGRRPSGASRGSVDSREFRRTANGSPAASRRYTLDDDDDAEGSGVAGPSPTISRFGHASSITMGAAARASPSSSPDQDLTDRMHQLKVTTMELAARVASRASMTSGGSPAAGAAASDTYTSSPSPSASLGSEDMAAAYPDAAEAAGTGAPAARPPPHASSRRVSPSHKTRERRAHGSGSSRVDDGDTASVSSRRTARSLRPSGSHMGDETDRHSVSSRRTARSLRPAGNAALEEGDERSTNGGSTRRSERNGDGGSTQRSARHGDGGGTVLTARTERTARSTPRATAGPSPSSARADTAAAGAGLHQGDSSSVLPPAPPTHPTIKHVRSTRAAVATPTPDTGVGDIIDTLGTESQVGLRVPAPASPKQGTKAAAKAASNDEEDGGEDKKEGDDQYKFVRKTLPRTAFSHEEIRAEFRCLDYCPVIQIRPVDLEEQLRPVKANRKLRLFICITCYNEDGDELRRTLLGIAANLPALAKAGVHWSEVAVSVLIDGREAMSQSMKDFLQHEIKVMDGGVMKTMHKARPVVMHLFERSVELTRHASQREYHYPLQLIVGVKERNGGKLNSHLWFFSGFCVQLNPKYVTLFDVGTVPHETALVHLFNAMENDPQVAGCCGEITVRNARPYNFLDAAQSFEYRMNHVLDKAAESVFGYISVLPGAFSAYRWVAIRGEPLSSYFTIEEISIRDLGPFLANMYLAEDRILCFEILAKRHRQWLLRYVPQAQAETDVPGSLVELIKQRRRWLNGSFFSLLYYLYNFPRFMRTSHGCGRKAFLLFQFGFFLTMAALSWFTISTLMLSYLVIFYAALQYAKFGLYEMKILFAFFYTILLFLQVLIGLVGRVQQMASLYMGVSLMYAILMFFSIMLGIWLVWTSVVSWFVGLAFACCLCSYLIAALIHGSLFPATLMFIQFLLLLPVFVNVFPIYSFANLQDISWGTKEGNLQAEQRRFHEGMAARAERKAAKAEAALERLMAEAQTQRMRAAMAGPLGTIKVTQEQVTALAVHGGADLMKVIDEDKDVAGYVNVTQMGKTDAMLQMSVDQAATVQKAMGVLTSDEAMQQLIKDAKKLTKIHQEAAERETRLAEQLAIDKQAMTLSFSYFRIRMLMAWVFSNALFVLLVMAYDTHPPLTGYAFYAACSVIYTIGLKLIFSVVFQCMRCTRWSFRRVCGCCYRIDTSESGVSRVVCCCRPSDYYILDDLWEQEHGFAHTFPEEGLDVTIIMNQFGLTLYGYMEDGTPLYMMPDGTGPYVLHPVTQQPILASEYTATLNEPAAAPPTAAASVDEDSASVYSVDSDPMRSRVRGRGRRGSDASDDSAAERRRARDRDRERERRRERERDRARRAMARSEVTARSNDVRRGKKGRKSKKSKKSNTQRSVITRRLGDGMSDGGSTVRGPDDTFVRVIQSARSGALSARSEGAGGLFGRHDTGTGRWIPPAVHAISPRPPIAEEEEERYVDDDAVQVTVEEEEEFDDEDDDALGSPAAQVIVDLTADLMDAEASASDVALK